ncbi:ROK family protein [Nocardioides flavescens]|uniref:ROK family protein n=1 Tax=Nocardioides flavescens TaxID=2691959 RepID=A0A6L7F294_9ACTN|nr:ROK family protein [Nocardioides flavescens]
MSPQPRTGLGTNQEAVRRHNLGTLLRHVHRRGQSTRADLTRGMGLNRSTIAGLVTELESLCVVESTDTVGSPRGAGRPSVVVRLAPSGPYVVAVEVGVDRMVVARVGLGGVVHQRATAISSGTEAWQVGSTVASLVREVVDQAPSDAAMVGIGIAVPGLVRRSDGLVRLAPNLEWADVSFGSIVLAALGVEVPVSLANDADLGALAEHERGVAVGVGDLIYVSGNVGVGAGIITGGISLAGAGGYAGEIGHLQFKPGGRPCHCGNRGCWETEVGAHAIAQAISLPTDQVPRLDEVLAGYSRPTRELRAIGTMIGHGLASVINAVNPEMIVLGGYFSALHSLVRDEIEAGVSDRTLSSPFETVSLELPALGADSVLMGAAEMAFEPLFTDPVSALGSAIQDVRTRVAG